MDIQEFKTRYHLQLNDQQAAAVQETFGETLLVAVPGSGKTATILARIGYLTAACGIPAESILAITYTKAAANEMEARYRSIFSTPTGSPRFSTIHSLCVAILRDASMKNAERLPALEADPGKIIRRVLHGKYSVWPSDHLVRQLSTLLTLVKNRMFTAEEREALDVPDLKVELPKLSFEAFFQDYESYKRQNRIMDFDDQLLFAYETLQTDAETAGYFRARYRHIFMDEAQDTSLLQFRILELLAQDADSLFVAGDDDQSIYSFRGADPDYMLRFADQYPAAKVFYLNTNYRSLPAIVEDANRFIQINQARYRKEASPSREGTGTVEIQQKKDMKEFYADAVSAAQDAAENPNTTLAIMARNNFTLLPLAMELDWLNIPFRRRDNYGAFFSHPTVAGVLGAMRLALCPWDLEALLDTRQLFGLYFTNAFIARLTETVDVLADEDQDLNVLEVAMDLSRDKPYVRHALEQLYVLMNCTPSSDPVAVVEVIRHLVPSRVLQREKSAGAVISSNVYFEVLTHIASMYSNLQSFSDTLETYARSKTTTTKDANVTLTTIHSAKGLEFDEVIVLDALSGILPVDDIDSLLDPEEEARIFYVAATRAKEHLTFYVPNAFFKIPAKPSAYIQRLLGTPLPELEPESTQPADCAAAQQGPGGSRFFAKASTTSTKFSSYPSTTSTEFSTKASSQGSTGASTASTLFSTLGMEVLSPGDSKGDGVPDPWDTPVPEEPSPAPAPEPPNPPAPPIDLEIGDTVRHKNYGTGEILFFEPEKVMVDFAGIGIRRVRKETLTKV